MKLRVKYWNEDMGTGAGSLAPGFARRTSDRCGRSWLPPKPGNISPQARYMGVTTGSYFPRSPVLGRWHFPRSPAYYAWSGLRSRCSLVGHGAWPGRPGRHQCTGADQSSTVGSFFRLSSTSPCQSRLQTWPSVYGRAFGWWLETSICCGAPVPLDRTALALRTW